MDYTVANTHTQEVRSYSQIEYTGKKIFTQISLISIIFNFGCIIYAYTANYLNLAQICFTLILSTVVSNVIYYAGHKEFAFHFYVTCYILAFTYGAFINVGYYSTILLYFVAMLFPFFYSEDKRIHMFYFVLCLVCGVVFVCTISNSIDRVEPYRVVVEIIILLGMGFSIYKLSSIYVNGMRSYQLKLKDRETKLKENNTLILAQNQKLDETNQQLRKYIDSNIQLEQYAHVASHDLKSPLRTVSSFTGLLKRKAYTKLDEKEQEYFDFIEKGTKQMSDLVNDLLVYSKANTQKVNKSKIRIKDLITNIEQNLEFTINEANAKISCHGLPEEILADETKIRQLFQNLISNALKFIPEDRIPDIQIIAKKYKDKWKFTVSDNGIGIPPHYQESIFQAFKQLHTKDEFEGTGLGLSICKKIVELHGGEIWVDSKAGIGSSFHFTIKK